MVVSITRRNYFRPTLRALGFREMRVHDLRHTAASLWLATGFEPHKVAQIWLGGTEKANVVVDISATLELKNGVKLIGGFAGTETLASQSIPAGHVTILNGGGTTTVVSGLDNAASTVLIVITVVATVLAMKIQAPQKSGKG